MECLTFCTVGEGEAETFHNQTRVAYEGLEVPREPRVTMVEEGPDGHCQASLCPLSQSIVCDWFEETLEL